VAERVVLDTNVCISGTLWRGKPYQCLLLARAGIVRPCYCDAMLSELREKLRSKFGFSQDQAQAVADDLKSIADRVDIPGDLHVVPDDPDDDKFVECAVVAAARTIISGDRHLLRLRDYRGIRVMSPAEFIASLPSA
jgi:putative PIN family toxin of toxin-antitoxin system